MDKEFQFKNENDLSKWIVTSDKDNDEGQSVCTLELSPNGKGLFTGNLCLDVPKDGKIAKSGYCNMRSTPYRVNIFCNIHHVFMLLFSNSQEGD